MTERVFVAPRKRDDEGMTAYTVRVLRAQARHYALLEAAETLRQHEELVRFSAIDRPLRRDAVFGTDLASDFEWAAQVVEEMTA